MVRDRTLTALLFGLALFDAVLVVWAYAFPELWFWAFHGSSAFSPEGELFLRRCGANWAAFCLLQTLAWRRWRREPGWLALIAGVRLSDIFTDLSYTLLSGSTTWFTWAALPLMSAINLGIGVVLWRSYRARAPGAAAQS